VLAGVVNESYGVEITFSQWFAFGFPISILFLFLSWLYLTKVAFKFPNKEFAGGKEEIYNQIKELGEMSFEEKMISLVFLLTALAWITRSFLLSVFIPGMDDTIIAITSAIIIFLLPNETKKTRMMTWGDAVKLPWGILILFGGGMALATGFEVSGLAKWLGSQMTAFENISLLLLLLILVASVNFITEITSNLATTAMLLPVLVSLASAIEVHPYFLLVGATVAASCAFMLPVATPPNAVVFGSGYLKIEDMVKKGFWLNVVSIVLLTFIVYFLLPVIWDLS
jgi:sodium-dependent dicarboxylate transporter 2/3/5